MCKISELLVQRGFLHCILKDRSNYLKLPVREEKNYACLFLLCQVCKYYLCGFCPAELFTNTRSDLGKSVSLVIFIHLRNYN